MSLLEKLVDGMINAKEPLMAVLIFVVIIGLLLFLLVKLAMGPGEGLQTMVTNLTGDYRISNAQVIKLTQQLGEISTEQAKLKMEVSILTQRAATSDINAKEAKDLLQETLDKLDLMTDELARVHRELKDARDLVAIKDGRIIELESHATSLQGEVDSLRGQIVLLQSVQKTNLGETTQ